MDFNNLSEIQKMQIQAILDSHREEQARINPIHDHFSKDHRNFILEIFTLGDEYQFVQYLRKGDDNPRWMAFINYEPLNYMSDTLDGIILVALSHKYEGHNGQAAYYMAKMLGMPGEG